MNEGIAKFIPFVRNKFINLTRRQHTFGAEWNFAISSNVLFFMVWIACIGSLRADEKNPFLCDVPLHACWTHEDWQVLQQKLRMIDLAPLLQQNYPQDQGYTTFEDFLQRCSRGIRQTFIDPAKGLFPQKSLEKIGEGGDLCIVSYASYDGLYPEFIQANAIALEAVGFNGYYLYAIGDFPNPTDQSMQFVGVPYSFKMGMMLEAKKLGFTKVLWIDSAVMPLRDPTPLFDWVEKTGALFLDTASFSTLWRYIFPSTVQLLKELTGTDVLRSRHVWGAIFGLKLNTSEASSFIDAYYQFAGLGFPFISCYPEQFVFSAIIGQEKYKKWVEESFPNLLSLDFSEQINPRGEIDGLKKLGYYFYLRRH
jgi:hypothetical protein